MIASSIKITINFMAPEYTDFEREENHGPQQTTI